MLLLIYRCPLLHWMFTRDGLVQCVQCTCTSANFVTHMRSGSFDIESFVHNILTILRRDFKRLLEKSIITKNLCTYAMKGRYPCIFSSPSLTHVYDIPNVH